MTFSSSSNPTARALGHANVLSRLGETSLSQNSSFTALQSQVDGLVTHFVDEAANPATLAALMAGGMAYRFGRVGILGMGEALAARSGTLVRCPSRPRNLKP